MKKGQKQRSPERSVQEPPSACSSGDRACRWADVLSVFSAALMVRLLFLFESSSSPFWATPLVDEETYDQLARSFAAGAGLSDGFFWQPFFYPIFLSAVYGLTDGSMVCARIIQSILGSVTSVLVYLLASAIFDRRIGVLAGFMAALCGPLVFFDGRLLATQWACLWSVVLILLLLRAEHTQSALFCLALGLCAGLSVITRPVFLPFLLASLVWLTIAWERRSGPTGRLTARLALILIGFALVTLPVAKLSRDSSGRFSVMPASSGINLYIGNHPDAAGMIRIRPGWEWDQLTRLPVLHGVKQESETPRFFRRQFVDHVRSEPVRFASGLASKTLQFACPRELPRNVDIYLFRKWSRVLSLLVWKVGAFGFPFGVLLPLFLIGLVDRWRRVPVPVKMFLLLYPASIILVFVTARYRTPFLPVMTVVAAAGPYSLVDMLRQRRWRMIGVTGLAALILLTMVSFAGPYPQEAGDYEAEMYYLLGNRASREGRPQEAVELLSKALQIDPAYGDAHNELGVALQELGRLDLAIEHYSRAARIDPRHATAWLNWGRALSRQGRYDEAAERFRRSLTADPHLPGVHNSYGIALSGLGKLDEAVRELSLSLRLQPDQPDVCNNLAAVLYQQGNVEEAIRYYEMALRMQPDHLPALENLATAFAAQGRSDEATRLYRTALEQAIEAEDAPTIARLRRKLK